MSVEIYSLTSDSIALALFSFIATSLICFLQLSCLSIFIPKYLNEYVWKSFLPFNLNSKFSFLRLGLNLKNSVFVTLTVILLALNQLDKFLKSWFMSLFNILADLLIWSKLVSSAKWWRTRQNFKDTIKANFY